jgi:hypothetical protein
MKSIPNFNDEKGREFILNHKDPYIKLAYKKDIEKTPTDSKEFLDFQEKLFEEKSLVNLFAKQYDSGAWEPPEKDDVFGPLQKSTIWTLVLFGYMGLNGKKIPGIAKAVDYIFDTQFDYDKQIFHNNHPIWGDFMQSHNSTILRALILLGFETRKDVKETSFHHLKLIHGKEGFCKYKKGDHRCSWGLIKNLLFFHRCSWGLIKNLLFFAEWPDNWKNKEYEESVKACQDYLLSYNLSKADYPREKPGPNPKWLNFSIFKTYHSDIFEGLEALVQTGVKSHSIITKTLLAVGDKCIDNQTWNCGLNVNMKLKLEKKDQPSPWLTLRGLRINDALR